MNKFSILTVCASAALLSGCSSNEPAIVESSTQNVIGFHVVGNSAETRATPITSSNLTTTDFDVFAFTKNGTIFMGDNSNDYAHDGVKIEYKEGQWTYNDPTELRYWPNEPLDFYAINPSTVSESMAYHFVRHIKNGSQKIEYTLFDEYATTGDSENHDIMYAIAKDQTQSTNSGKVKLMFKHILSQVIFKAKTKDNDLQVDINYIKIHNFKIAGTFTFPSNATASPSRNDWTLKDLEPDENGSIKNAFTAIKDANISVTSSTAVTDITSSTPMLFIPQELVGWKENDGVFTKANADEKLQCYLEINCKIKQGNVYIHGSEDSYNTIYVPFSATLEPGNCYIYTLVFGGGYTDQGVPVLSPIKFDPEVTEWATTSGESTLGGDITL